MSPCDISLKAQHKPKQDNLTTQVGLLFMQAPTDMDQALK